MRSAEIPRLPRLATCVLIESHDEWQVAEHLYLSEESMAQLTPPAPATTIHTAQSTTRKAPHGTSYTTSRGFI